jgi:hypothetical protein
VVLFVFGFGCFAAASCEHLVHVGYFGFLGVFDGLGQVLDFWAVGAGQDGVGSLVLGIVSRLLRVRRF